MTKPSGSDYTGSNSAFSEYVSRIRRESGASIEGHSSLTPTQSYQHSTTRVAMPFGSQNQVLPSSELIAILDQVIEITQSGFDDDYSCWH